VASTPVVPLPEGVARAYLELLGLDLEPGDVDLTVLRQLQRVHLEKSPTRPSTSSEARRRRSTRSRPHGGSSAVVAGTATT
jgi:hypothetical protein